MNYNYYLVTIKTRGAPYTSASDLYTFYQKLKVTMKDTEFSDLRIYEKTKTERLHFHTICITRENIFRICKLVNTNRLYVHFKQFPSPDYDNIRNYLLKQVPNREVQQDLLAENLFLNENCFSNNKYADLRIYNLHPLRI